MQSHIHRVHVCLAVTCHLHFFTCYCSNMGVKQIPKQESAQKVDPREEISPARTWTWDLSISSLALYHWTIPPPPPPTTPIHSSRPKPLPKSLQLHTLGRYGSRHRGWSEGGAIRSHKRFPGCLRLGRDGDSRLRGGLLGVTVRHLAAGVVGVRHKRALVRDGWPQETPVGEGNSFAVSVTKTGLHLSPVSACITNRARRILWERQSITVLTVCYLEITLCWQMLNSND